MKLSVAVSSEIHPWITLQWINSLNYYTYNWSTGEKELPLSYGPLDYTSYNRHIPGPIITKNDSPYYHLSSIFKKCRSNKYGPNYSSQLEFKILENNDSLSEFLKKLI